MDWHCAQGANPVKQNLEEKKNEKIFLHKNYFHIS